MTQALTRWQYSEPLGPDPVEQMSPAFRVAYLERADLAAVEALRGGDEPAPPTLRRSVAPGQVSRDDDH